MSKAFKLHMHINDTHITIITKERERELDMKGKQSFDHYTINGHKVGFTAVILCILAPLFFLTLLKNNSHQFAILSLQLSIGTYGPLSRMEEGGASFGERVVPSAGANSTNLFLQSKDAQEKNDSIVGTANEMTKLPFPLHENPIVKNTDAAIVVEKRSLDLNRSVVGFEITMQDPTDMKEKLDGNKTIINKKEVQVTHVSNEKPEQNDTRDFFSGEKTRLPSNLSEKQPENQSVVETVIMKLPQNLKKEEDENRTIIENKEEKVQDKSQIVEGKDVPQESKLVCDFSGLRSDTCSLHGDIRILTKASTIILNLHPQSPITPESSPPMKLRPYARKWEVPVMQNIKEVTISQSPLPDKQPLPPCSVNHSIPAVVFSTGGFLGNFFHDFTDVLVPLFVTSRHFQGEVQFLATDFNSKWINKYKPILKQLSNYEIINMDSKQEVHCFPEAHIGLLNHKVLGIDPSRTPNNYTMINFKRFLRSSLSLNKDSTKVIPKKSRKKPRLLMLLRKGSRSLINAREVISMARSIGFKVITAGPEDTRDLAKFAHIVNTCDVMMGVHGAGLANMVFLPTNASLIQIVPWGGLKWACWHDFGRPATDMGVNYVEYEIKEEESSLIQEYPRDHAVFKDPQSIHRQGWNLLWSIFLDKQKVKLDVSRFRGVLLESYQSLKQ